MASIIYSSSLTIIAHMPHKPRTYRPLGYQTKREEYRANGGRPYDKAAWRKESKQKRADSPLCEDCLRAGKVTVATQVHHTVRLEDGGDLLDSETMSLCGLCHAIRTRRGE